MNKQRHIVADTSNRWPLLDLGTLPTLHLYLLRKPAAHYAISVHNNQRLREMLQQNSKNFHCSLVGSHAISAKLKAQQKTSTVLFILLCVSPFVYAKTQENSIYERFSTPLQLSVPQAIGSPTKRQPRSVEFRNCFHAKLLMLCLHNNKLLNPNPLALTIFTGDFPRFVMAIFVSLSTQPVARSLSFPFTSN